MPLRDLMSYRGLSTSGAAGEAPSSTSELPFRTQHGGNGAGQLAVAQASRAGA